MSLRKKSRFYPAFVSLGFLGRQIDTGTEFYSKIVNSVFVSNESAYVFINGVHVLFPN